jgi:parvulin-like peptidyl-prolyl isomerase
VTRPSSDGATDGGGRSGTPRRSRDWAAVLLALGAVAGAALAASQLVGRRATIPRDAVAVVGGAPIAESAYRRALDAVRADRSGGELDEAERKAVLDRLVDEELLLQRGLALDLVRRDPRLRGEVVSTVVTELVDEAGQREPTDDELRRFLEENAARFPAEPVVKVEQILFAAPAGVDPRGAEQKARAVAGRLAAGEPWEALRSLGDTPQVPLPDGFVSRRTLTESIGPTAAQVALELAEGATSDVVRSGAGYVLLRIVGRRAGEARDFATIRDSVRAEYLRRAGEARLRAALAALRADTVVTVRGP